MIAFWRPDKNRNEAGWQKLCEGTKGLRRKVWTQTKILSPNICYFVAIYALFGRFWANKVLFWFLGQEVHYYIVHILHIVLNEICKFVITCKNDAIVARIANMRRTKMFVAIFALAERLPTSAMLN